MSRTITETRESVYCRFCGHLDNMTYCSKCGLELNVGAAAPWKFFVSRFSFLIQPICRFFCTFFFLLVYPRTFFRILENDGLAVDVAGILLSKRDVQFNPWRRPMAPASYLISVTIMTIILFRVSGLDAPIFEEMSDIIPQLPANFLKDGIEIAAGLAMEFIVVVLLFLTMTTYRLLLGIKIDKSKNFLNTFLIRQYSFCCALVRFLLFRCSWTIMFLHFPLQ